MKQRQIKTAGYSFAKQSARRAKRRSQVQMRQASPSEVARGLREKISYATSKADIIGHLSNGLVRYTGASGKTRRQWSATAKRRIEHLTNKK